MITLHTVPTRSLGNQDKFEEGHERALLAAFGNDKLT